MNYYNPYFYSIPSAIQTPKIGLLGRLFGSGGISLSNIINGTQRVLNFANQTIPLVKQVKPMIGNAKTMFKVMNEFKRSEKPVSIYNNINLKHKDNLENDNIKTNNNNVVSDTTNGPTFFV